jgi:hypothetical protein
MPYTVISVAIINKSTRIRYDLLTGLVSINLETSFEFRISFDSHDPLSDGSGPRGKG